MRLFPSFSLYPAGSDDLDRLITLYQENEDFLGLWPDTPPDSVMVKTDLDYSVKTGGNFLAICTAEGVFAGVVDYISSGFQGRPEYAYINLLMISPVWRRKGLGTAVLAKIENRIAVDPRVKEIQLAVQINNPPGRAFWESQGYTRFTPPSLQADGTMTCLYKKSLG